MRVMSLRSWTEMNHETCSFGRDRTVLCLLADMLSLLAASKTTSMVGTERGGKSNPGLFAFGEMPGGLFSDNYLGRSVGTDARRGDNSGVTLRLQLAL